MELLFINRFGVYHWKEYIFEDKTTKDKITRKFSKQLRDICEEYPTDLITHTKAMHKKFVEMDSMFSRDTKTININYQNNKEKQ